MRPNDTSQHSSSSSQGDLACPLCDGKPIVTIQRTDAFKYGCGASAVTLTVDLPVRSCPKCDFEFVDHEGDRIRHEAVCRHLGALTPGTVSEFR